MKSFPWHKLVSVRSIYRFLTWPFFIDRNSGPQVFICGSGRSGTTWLEEVINANGKARVVFEPFHMTKGKVKQQPGPWEFVDPDDTSIEIHENLKGLFYGRYRNKWTDSWNVSRFATYDFRLYKAIRAHGLLKYISLKFPEVSQVYIMRHPLAALSSYLPRNWPPRLDYFLGQAKLCDGLLCPHVDFIRSVDGHVGKIMLRWCLENYIALSQLEEQDATVVFYEDMVVRPWREVERLKRGGRIEFPDDILDKFSQPALHSFDRGLSELSEDERVSKWKKKLSPEQVAEAEVVLKHFGFERIYSCESALPLLDDPQDAIRLF